MYVCTCKYVHVSTVEYIQHNRTVVLNVWAFPSISSIPPTGPMQPIHIISPFFPPPVVPSDVLLCAQSGLTRYGLEVRHSQGSLPYYVAVPEYPPGVACITSGSAERIFCSAFFSPTKTPPLPPLLASLFRPRNSSIHHLLILRALPSPSLISSLNPPPRSFPSFHT